MVKILIIEDEEVLLSVLENKLKKEGHEVLTARDGEEGLKKIKDERPDLVLLDIVMPKMNGIEVMEALKKDKAVIPPPIIVISNSGQPVELEEAKRLGASDWLIKTEFDPREVLEKVQNLLREKGDSAKEELMASKENLADQSPATKKKSGAPKILIIEDDRFLRDLIVRKLESDGFDVAAAIDGEVGYKKIMEEKPDLILLDLILPGIDGFEVLSRMRANPEISLIPVVILSNLGQKEDIERGLQLGARDYLIKAHFTPAEIVEKVKQNL